MSADEAMGAGAERPHSPLPYDAWHADLEALRALAEASLAAASEAGARAEALVSCAMTRILRGEVRAARALLTEAEALAPRGLRAWISACTYHATLEDRSVFPHGGASSSPSLYAPDALREAAEGGDRVWEEFAGDARAEVLLAARFVREIVARAPALRFIIERGRALRDPADHRRKVAPLLQALASFSASCGPSREAGPGAYALRLLGELLWRVGDRAQATALLQRAADVYEGLGDLGQVADVWVSAGDLHAAPFASPLTFGEPLLDGESVDTGAWRLRQFDGEGVDLARARVCYAEADWRYAATASRRGLAHVALRRAYLAAACGSYEEARALAAGAARVLRSTGDLRGAWVAEAHVALADVAVDGRVDGEDFAGRLAAWIRGGGAFAHGLGLAALIARRGRWWVLDAGDPQRAIACFNLARVVFRALHADLEEAMVHDDLAALWTRAGDHSAALVELEAALARYRQVDSAEVTLGPRAELQQVLTLQTQVNVALAAEQPKALERAAAQMMACLDDPARCARLRDAGILDPALAFLRGRGATMRCLAFLMRGAQRSRDGDEGRAAAWFSRALEAAAACEEGERWFLSAIVYKLAGRRTEALDAFGRFVAAGGMLGGALGAVSEAMRASFGPAGAAAADGRRSDLDDLALSFYLQLEAWPEARAAVERLRQMKGDAPGVLGDDPSQARYRLGRLCEADGDLVGALEHYEIGLAELEARRGRARRGDLLLSIGGLLPDLHFAAARVAFRTASPTRGAWIASAGRAAAFFAQITERSRRSPSVRLQEAELAIVRSLLGASVGSEGDRARTLQLQARKDALERAINLADEGSVRFAGVDERAPSFSELCGSLVPGEVLLEHYASGDELLAWVVGREGLLAVHHSPSGARALGAMGRALRRQCAQVGAVGALSAALTRALLDPLGEALKNAERIVVVPSGPTRALPLHVLPLGRGCLADGRVVTYAPSAMALPLWRRRRASRNVRSLVVGAPVAMASGLEGGTRQPLEPLPGAALEARLVSETFGESQVELLRGADATPEAVRAALSKARVAHFATHSIHSSVSPLLSSLALANGASLTAGDILGEAIDADLVVLSACSSGVGQRVGGDDELGLTRSFLVAGARATVASLWPVRDDLALFVMARFYAALRTQRSPARALTSTWEAIRAASVKEVQEQLRHLWGGSALRRLPVNPAHPGVWGAFVCMSCEVP